MLGAEESQRNWDIWA